MDRSNTATNKNKDDAALRKSVDLIGMIKPGLTPLEQLYILRKTIECTDAWCKISSLGVKKMEEHIGEMANQSYSKNAKIECNGYEKIRAIHLIQNLNDTEIGIGLSRTNTRFGFMGVELFLTEKLSILAVQLMSRVTDCIELADEVKVVCADDAFLRNLMTHENGQRGNASLALNAVGSLARTLYWVKDVAQKRADAIGKGENSISMIGFHLKQALIEDKTTPKAA